MKAGSGDRVSLDKGKAHGRFRGQRHRARSQTTAHIRTATLLGQRILTLESAGGTALHPNDVIPCFAPPLAVLRSPAVSDLTTNTAGTDTAGVNEALDRSRRPSTGSHRSGADLRRRHRLSRPEQPNDAARLAGERRPGPAAYWRNAAVASST